ncbi:MAG: recombinase family protein [Rickettsiales bacterium]|jgi:DNA invertase Pin-like site-specific DNA recombinase|nr:recombinase family protein [Rickettsiales bacterium]
MKEKIQNKREGKNKLETANAKVIRCAIYTRKSSEEGLDLEYNSLANQRDSCEKYIESQKLEGWVLVTDSHGNPKYYDDGGFSGGTLERPALKELIKDIQLGLVDMVVVYKIDRLSRSLMDFSKLMDIFESGGCLNGNKYNSNNGSGKHKVSFISVTQNFNTNDSMGKLMLNILLSFAQFEREMTGDRIRDKIRMQKSKGMWTGGPVPLGYDNIDKKLIVNEEESKKVKLIFNTFLKTKSISETLKVLNNPDDSLNTLNEIVKTKLCKSKVGNNTFKSNKFDRSSLHKLLKNKIYLGLIYNKNTNNIYNGQHEAIIDKDIFNEVQNIFEEHLNNKIYDDKIININNHLSTHTGNNSNNGNNGNNNIIEHKIIHSPKLNSKVPYLLKGLMRCSCCNSILTPTYTTKKNGTVYRYYKSSKAMKHVINNTTNRECQLPSIHAEHIENIILSQIYKIIKTPQMIQGIIDDVIKKQKQMDANNVKNASNVNNTNEDAIKQILNLTDKDIIDNLKNIEVIWNELFPREQLEIINLLIKEIILSETNIKIVLNNLGFVQLLQEAGGISNLSVSSTSSISSTMSAISVSSENNSPSYADSINYTILNIPIDLRHKIGRSFITMPDGNNIVIHNVNTKRIVHDNYIDNAVLKALIQAEEWKEELNSGHSLNINSIAKREQKQNSYIARILDLAFLAPDIKKSILTNNAPLGLSLKDLHGMAELSWEEQRERCKQRSQLTMNN